MLNDPAVDVDTALKGSPTTSSGGSEVDRGVFLSDPNTDGGLFKLPFMLSEGRRSLIESFVGLREISSRSREMSG